MRRRRRECGSVTRDVRDDVEERANREASGL
jgi:hypothetical protein